ncbi:MAG: MBL fold metallo-hydrolase [Streptosporangiales bacterium]|nr:MBL fold metallo-hydrolase [Streptosporangiales bacterium]
MSDTPRGRGASHHVLTAGYVGRGTASTVGLVRDGDVLAIIDPGMVRSRSLILDALRELGYAAEDVTDVVFSHHHPDHTLNAALFPDARFHDHWAIYKDDTWEWRDAEGYELAPSVRLIRTPGHTAEDITTLVGTSDGVAAYTHVWWTSTAPDEDPYATDQDALRASRARVLAVADIVVPGHGEAFVPGDSTPGYRG